MKLSTARDLAVLLGATITGVSVAYLAADDAGLFDRYRRPALDKLRDEAELDGRATLRGEHGDLYIVETTYDGGMEKSRYLRPATEAEAAATEKAEVAFGGGSGVFGRTSAGDIVLPGDDAWAAGDGRPFGDTRLTFYRVG